MTDYSRERKRASDRASQRTKRARTKSYIARLERTVAELGRASPSDELGAACETQLARQQREIEALRKTLGRIARLASDGDDGLRIDDGHARSASGAGARGALTTPDEMHAAARLVSREGSKSSQEAFSLESWLPSQHRLPLVPDAAGRANFFATLNNSIITLVDSLRRLEMPVHFPSDEDDDDFCIRAVIDGWAAAGQKAPLDPVWRFIQVVDQTMYSRSGPLERLALLRIMRSMLVHRVRPGDAQRRTIPSYMCRSPCQDAIEHGVFIDYIVWPVARDHLIAIDPNYISEDEAVTFGSHIRFVWHYELRDAYNKHVLSAKYGFSREFDRSYHDLRSWTMSVECPYLFGDAATPIYTPPSDQSEISGSETLIRSTNDCNGSAFPFMSDAPAFLESPQNLYESALLTTDFWSDIDPGLLLI